MNSDHGETDTDWTVVRRYLNKIWRRKALVIGWGLIFVFVTVIVLEYCGYVDFVETNTPLETAEFAQIAGALGTVILSFALLLLYNQQTRIQEQRFKPHLTGEVDSLDILSSQFLIRNTGDGHAYDVEATWEIADYSRTWKIHSLAPGDEYGFPIINDGGNWLLNTNEIENYLQNEDRSTMITYRINCIDQFEDHSTFSGKVDFASVATRADSQEIWQKEPLEEISSEVSDIQDDIRKVRRYTKKRRKEEKWHDRLDKNRAIESLVREKGELSVYQIHRLTGISEATLEYRLSELDDVDALRYHENAQKATPARKLDESQSELNEY